MCIELYFIEEIPAWVFTILYIVDASLFVSINIIAIIYQIMYWKSFSYQISNQYIRIHSGVFTKTKTTIPFSRIQNINLAQGVFDRLFGLHTVKIETAGKSAGQQQGGPVRPEGYIPGVKDPSQIVQIIDQLVNKYTQTKLDSGIGDYIFQETDMAFDQFIAYILAKMKEGDELKTRVINYLERGTYMPSLKLAMKLAKFFEVQVEELFKLEDENQKPE